MQKSVASWLLLLTLASQVNAQWSFVGVGNTAAPTEPPTLAPFCSEVCEGEEGAACACGRDFTSRCHATCAGYTDEEIADETCHRKHCRTAGTAWTPESKSPCDENSKCTTIQQYTFNGECIGSTYSCVQSSLLLTCPMAMDPQGGACLTAGGSKYYMPNQCFAQSLGLESERGICEAYDHSTEGRVEPEFFYDDSSLQYYYDFSNDTLIEEYGDIIIEDTCGCGFEYDPVHVTFTEFCLSFWNECFRDCKKKKYEERQNTYWTDPDLTYGDGLCIDPCNEADGEPFACDDTDNCYPIRNEPRCFPTFDKQYECMTTNCPNWNSTDEPTDPVCVKVYAGVNVDNVYRGGGDVSKYTYRDTCMAKCEGFQEGDWEEGTCNAIAVSACEAQCEGTEDTGSVCAAVEVAVELENDNSGSDNADDGDGDDEGSLDLITVTYETQFQTIASACMSECLGWTDFTEGECEDAGVSLEDWSGYNSQTCGDYAEDVNEDNYLNYCDDECTENCGETFGLTGCEACSECKGSPRCSGWRGFQGSNCTGYGEFAEKSNYKYCDDKHTGIDPDFDGKSGCEACTECEDSDACDGGFRGPDNINCDVYNIANVKQKCHEHFHTGTDPSFIGKNACEGCPTQCAGNLVCSQESGFVGNPNYQCEGYAKDENQGFCSDPHVGLDSSFDGQSACDACSECSNAPACLAPKKGFVGYDYLTCETGYAKGKPNHNFCNKDIHQGQDSAFSGQTGCEGCADECSEYWRCNIPESGFVGYRGSQCDSYAKGQKNYAYCAIDTHLGTDSKFDGQTACEACSGCDGNRACTAPDTGFVGSVWKYLCEDYAEKTQWCDDIHTGKDTSFIGQTACTACSECANADVCREEFKGLEGYCESYTGSNTKRCDDGYVGNLDQFKGTYACDQCDGCKDSPTCAAAFSFNDFGCERYAEGADNSWFKYCGDTHNSDYPASSEFVGQSACEACPNECKDSPACN